VGRFRGAGIAKKILHIQCEGIEREGFGEFARSRAIAAYALPNSQTLKAAWLFRIVLDDGGSLEFSSAGTEVVDWQEVGSLTIRLVDKSSPPVEDFLWVDMLPLEIVEVDVLIYEDEDVISECGLVICGVDGSEIIVAAGIPPGSVSIMSPIFGGAFEPQFPVSTCKRNRF
jgi:hypothetical protein